MEGRARLPLIVAGTLSVSSPTAGGACLRLKKVRAYLASTTARGGWE
jgi:hypothetical protein